MSAHQLNLGSSSEWFKPFLGEIDHRRAGIDTQVSSSRRQMMVEKFLSEGTDSTAEFKDRVRFLKATVFEQGLERCAFIPVLPVLFAAESVVKGLGFVVGEESAWHLRSRVRLLVQRM